MTKSWSGPARLLIDQVASDLGGLRSLLQACELGVNHLNWELRTEHDAVGVVIDWPKPSRKWNGNA
jgi:hypothetical protein